MRHTFYMTAPFAAMFFSAIIMTSCKQGEGARCGEDSDCEKGLSCCIRKNEPEDVFLQLGSCQRVENCEFVDDDAGVNTDATVTDGPTSDTVLIEDSTVDAATDTSTSDAIEPIINDASNDDSSSDATTDAQMDQGPSDGS